MTWLEGFLPRTILLPIRLLLCGIWIAMLYFGIRYAPDAVMTDPKDNDRTIAAFPLASVPQSGAALDCPLCRACPECPLSPRHSATISSIRERRINSKDGLNGNGNGHGNGANGNTNGNGNGNGIKMVAAPTPKRPTISPLLVTNGQHHTSDNNKKSEVINGNGTSHQQDLQQQHCEHCPTRTPSPSLSSQNGNNEVSATTIGRALSPASSAAIRRHCECSARDCHDLARRRVPRVVVRKYYHLLAILMFVPAVLIEVISTSGMPYIRPLLGIIHL
jgi:hypothetical protein